MSKGKAGLLSRRTSALSILMLLCYFFSSHAHAQEMPAVGTSDPYTIYLFIIGILSILVCRRRFF